MVFGTIAEVAQSASVQPSTLVRFAQALGYVGFSDLQAVFRAHARDRWPDYRERLDELRSDPPESGPSGLLAGFACASMTSIGRLQDTTDLGTHLVEWPTEPVVKFLCFYHPDDDAALRVRQEREMLRAAAAARGTGHELLLEIIAGKRGVLVDDTVASVLGRLCDIGLRPDWWKLEPQPRSRAWKVIGDVIRARDPFCRGILMLGLDAPQSELARGFADGAVEPLVRGFAVGRTIFAEPAQAWFAGRTTDEQAKQQMAKRFGSLVEVWQTACGDTAISEGAHT
jgi:hypothetical protein